jgi:phosphoribosylaminoimidazole (AIR) synthetase
MGTGFFVAVAPEDADEALEVLGRRHGCQAVGRVEEGSGVVLETLGLGYDDY